MTHILLVEDDDAIAAGLQDNLEYEGYSVRRAPDAERAAKLIRDLLPDLIVLDVRLPRISGYEFCRRIRADGSVMPVLMLTARGEESDRVLGLDLGADDYMSKPFSVPELLARVRALLRRASQEPSLPMEVAFGEVRVDFRRFEAKRSGRAVELTPKEYGLLRLLAAKEGLVVTRDELLESVWGFKAPQTTRTVDNHIATLRAKLEPDAVEPAHLITVHGVGYKFIR